jgi:hypothetical protein
MTSDLLEGRTARAAVNLNQLDGLHDPERAAAAAELMAGAARYISHAARKGGVTNPADLYAMLGQIKLTVESLPDTTAGLTEFLVVHGPSLQVSSRPAPGAEASDMVKEAVGQLTMVSEAALDVAVALDQAQGAVAHLYLPEEGEEAEPQGSM